MEAGSILNERRYCARYLKALALKIFTSMLSALVVVAVNNVLKYVLTRFARFERHHTVTGEQQSVMKKLFLAQFINTGTVNSLTNKNICANNMQAEKKWRKS